MIFDTHCHVYDEKYIEGSIEVIKKSIQEGVDLFMIPGDNIINSKKAVYLSSLFPQVYCAIGIHPSDVMELDIEEAINNYYKNGGDQFKQFTYENIDVTLTFKENTFLCGINVK